MASSIWVFVPVYAKKAGYSPRYIHDLIKKGKISKRAIRVKEGRNQVHVQKANADILENVSADHKNRLKGIKTGPGLKKDDPRNTLDPAKSVKKSKKAKTEEEQHNAIEGTDFENQSLNESQRIEGAYKALIRKNEYEIKTKLSVLVSEVEKESFECGRLTRDAVLGVIDRNAPILAAETDERVIADILRTELTQALETVS